MRCQDILAKLISYPSVTPQDAGCQAYIEDLLTQAGFHCQRLDAPPVANLYAQWGSTKPLLVFAGHTDVVPAGTQTWQFDPFTLTADADKLYGRGVADMKGALACMLAAVLRLKKEGVKLHGSIGLLFTSGEEGDDYLLGTPKVMEYLQQQQQLPDYCIVGEPSSTAHIGDMLKIGRRGSLSGYVTVKGKQGHVAYPHLADNPIHRLAPALVELTTIQWDTGTEHFPPTSLQITHIQAGGQANNIIPGDVVLHFNIRYSPQHNVLSLQEKIQACFNYHHLQTEIRWQHSGAPFLTAQGRLLDACKEVIAEHTDQLPELSTSGGTSDGRFIAPYGVEVIELGLVNATIHQVNEHINAADLDKLSAMYYSLCLKLLS